MASDLDIHELRSADAATASALNELFDPESSLWLLREHHQTNPHTALLIDDFFLVIDADVDERGHGAPEVLGVHFERDLGGGTIRATTKYQALIPLAQNWLIGRGADPEAIREPEGWFSPLDAASGQIEDLLRSSGERFEVHDSYSRHTDEPIETWVITTDGEPPSPETPFTVFVWRRENADSATYTVQQAAFATLDGAYEWTKDTSVRVPAPGRSPSSARALAARSDGRGLASGPVTEAVPLNGPTERRRPSR
ncbi:hypothetical protein [Streptacidiphilus sp. MAP5-52]|uniref:hypothetical protein n=1 Tax=Streptacidiphilus sp. MAP5-52 TaxID=3156267 RepID=UPI003513817B